MWKNDDRLLQSLEKGGIEELSIYGIFGLAETLQVYLLLDRPYFYCIEFL